MKPDSLEDSEDDLNPTGAVRWHFTNVVLDERTLELSVNSKVVSIERKSLELLLHLLRNADSVVTKDQALNAVWPGRFLSESVLAKSISRIRQVIDDTDQEIIKTVHGIGYRFVAEVRTEVFPGSDFVAAKSSSSPSPGSVRRRSVLWFIGATVFLLLGMILVSPEMRSRTGAFAVLQMAEVLPRGYEQEVHFTQSADGTRIAYAVTGDGTGPPVVLAPIWMGHLERGLGSPMCTAEFIEDIGEGKTVVRYDGRGMGLSGRGIKDFSLEARVSDLESVVDDLQFGRFYLVGYLDGAAVSIAYAERHPERVAGLILYSSYLQWPAPTIAGIQMYELVVNLVRSGWGKDNEASRQFFSSVYMPDADDFYWHIFNEYQRRSATAEDMTAFVETPIDVSKFVAHVQTPALVLHRRGDTLNPFDHGRQVAKLLPNARFVPLEGQNFVMSRDDAAWYEFVDAIRIFFENTEKTS